MQIEKLNQDIIDSNILNRWGGMCTNHKNQSKRPHGIGEVDSYGNNIYGFDSSINAVGYMYIDNIVDVTVNTRASYINYDLIINIIESPNSYLFEKTFDLYLYLRQNKYEAKILYNKVNCEHCNYCSIAIKVKHDIC